MKKVSCAIACCIAIVFAGYVNADPPQNDSVQATEISVEKRVERHKGGFMPPKRNFPGKKMPSGPGRFSNINPHNRFHDFDNMRKNDPEKFKLLIAEAEMDRKIKETVRRFKAEKDPTQKEALRKQIIEMCTKHFEIRQQRRELDLARMKAWLNQMEEGVNKSRNNKDKIIDQRVKFLLDDNFGEF